jgi:putative MATE family efflux protein
MLIAMTGAALNIILDFILVYGIEGIVPPLYLEGAAWASLIAQAVMAIMALYLLKRKTDSSLIPRFPVHPELGRLVLMSLNLFVRAVALNIAFILAVREATALGEHYIGAHTIAVNLWLFAAFFIDGYAAAGNIMGGRLLGSKDYNGLWLLAKKIVYYGSAVSVVLMALAFLFYEPLGRLFSNEPLVLQAFYSIFFIVILGLPVNSIAFVLDGIFKGLGEMRYLRNVLLSATFLGFVPALYLGMFLGWGLYGIWIAFTVWMLFRGGALFWKFRHKFYPLLQKA